MGFLAKLFINGRALTVLDTNIGFYRDLDPATYLPAGMPMGGVFNVVLEADGNTDILHLAMSNDRQCKGHIRFYKHDGLSKLYDFEFFDTYVVGYRHSFEAVHGPGAEINVVFSPGILRIGDMVFEKHWKTTDLKAHDKLAATPNGEGTPQVTDSYYEDQNGKRLGGDELPIGEKVNLILHTKNAIGKTVDIDLSENNRDFEYKGQKLEDDLLENVKIIASPHKVRLKVIAEEEEGEEQS